MKGGNTDVKLWFLAVALGFLILSYSVFLVASPETVQQLGREDGFFETVGAMSFLLAAGCFLWLFIKDTTENDLILFKTRRNLFFLALGLLLFFGFGEEISWGQRIMGVETPEILREQNLQGEINIHNLRVFHGLTAAGEKKQGLAAMISGARLFSLFWFCFCVLVPAVSLVSRSTSALVKRLGLPLVPLSIGLLFILNYAIAKGLSLFTARGLGDSLTEIKESGFAMLFLLVGVWFVVDHHSGYRSDSLTGISDLAGSPGSRTEGTDQ